MARRPESFEGTPLFRATKSGRVGGIARRYHLKSPGGGFGFNKDIKARRCCGPNRGSMVRHAFEPGRLALASDAAGVTAVSGRRFCRPGPLGERKGPIGKCRGPGSVAARKAAQATKGRQPRRSRAALHAETTEPTEGWLAAHVLALSFGFSCRS